MAKLNLTLFLVSTTVIMLAVFDLTLSAVQVFEHIGYQGSSKTLAPFKACLDFPATWQHRISSVNLNDDGCTVLCEYKRCLGKCIKFYPGVRGDFDLTAIDFNDKVSSYKNCESSFENNIPNN